MAKELQGRRIAILAASGVEQVELVEPRRAVTEAGADTEDRKSTRLNSSHNR
jgi:protease I